MTRNTTRNVFGRRTFTFFYRLAFLHDSLSEKITALIVNKVSHALDLRADSGFIELGCHTF